MTSKSLTRGLQALKAAGDKDGEDDLVKLGRSESCAKESRKRMGLTLKGGALSDPGGSALTAAPRGKNPGRRKWGPSKALGGSSGSEESDFEAPIAGRRRGEQAQALGKQQAGSRGLNDTGGNSETRKKRKVSAINKRVGNVSDRAFSSHDKGLPVRQTQKRPRPGTSGTGKPASKRLPLSSEDDDDEESEEEPRSRKVTHRAQGRKKSTPTVSVFDAEWSKGSEGKFDSIKPEGGSGTVPIKGSSGGPGLALQIPGTSKQPGRTDEYSVGERSRNEGVCTSGTAREMAVNHGQRSSFKSTSVFAALANPLTSDEDGGVSDGTRMFKKAGDRPGKEFDRIPRKSGLSGRVPRRSPRRPKPNKRYLDEIGGGTNAVCVDEVKGNDAVYVDEVVEEEGTIVGSHGKPCRASSTHGRFGAGTKREEIGTTDEVGKGATADESDGVEQSQPLSQGHSQSQQLELKIQPLKQKSKRTLDERIRESILRSRTDDDELRRIREAFVVLYPPPPSNQAAQGRYEAMHGREMTPGMEQELWETALKPWSDRWWELYQKFGDYARSRKMKKSLEKSTKITVAESKRWAKAFYKEHGDARPAESEDSATLIARLEAKYRPRQPVSKENAGSSAEIYKFSSPSANQDCASAPNCEKATQADDAVYTPPKPGCEPSFAVLDSVALSNSDCLASKLNEFDGADRDCETGGSRAGDGRLTVHGDVHGPHVEACDVVIEANDARFNSAGGARLESKLDLGEVENANDAFPESSLFGNTCEERAQADGSGVIGRGCEGIETEASGQPIVISTQETVNADDDLSDVVPA